MSFWYFSIKYKCFLAGNGSTEAFDHVAQFQIWTTCFLNMTGFGRIFPFAGCCKYRATLSRSSARGRAYAPRASARGLPGGGNRQRVGGRSHEQPPIGRTPAVRGRHQNDPRRHPGRALDENRSARSRHNGQSKALLVTGNGLFRQLRSFKPRPHRAGFSNPGTKNAVLALQWSD